MRVERVEKLPELPLAAAFTCFGSETTVTSNGVFFPVALLSTDPLTVCKTEVDN